MHLDPFRKRQLSLIRFGVLARKFQEAMVVLQVQSFAIHENIMLKIVSLPFLLYAMVFKSGNKTQKTFNKSFEATSYWHSNTF